MVLSQAYPDEWYFTYRWNNHWNSSKDMTKPSSLNIDHFLEWTKQYLMSYILLEFVRLRSHISVIHYGLGKYCLLCSVHAFSIFGTELMIYFARIWDCVRPLVYYFGPIHKCIVCSCVLQNCGQIRENVFEWLCRNRSRESSSRSFAKFNWDNIWIYSACK